MLWDVKQPWQSICPELWRRYNELYSVQSICFSIFIKPVKCNDKAVLSQHAAGWLTLNPCGKSETVSKRFFVRSVSFAPARSTTSSDSMCTFHDTSEACVMSIPCEFSHCCEIFSTVVAFKPGKLNFLFRFHYLSSFESKRGKSGKWRADKAGEIVLCNFIRLIRLNFFSSSCGAACADGVAHFY